MLHCHTVTVEKIGGKALPCILDVRDEVAVKAAVKSAVDKVSCVPWRVWMWMNIEHKWLLTFICSIAWQFGGIDILVNNASAISLTPTLQTDMKRYDLMHNINTRGTFLV